MSKPTRDQTDAALCTPPRDMRDVVWIRTYCNEFARLRNSAPEAAADAAAEQAGREADLAVEQMPIPAHRRAEVGLS